ncbi:hypothetical protein ABW19_dt0204488 [Dactylella cylindrospora]|nr:hypothetical protein ABW19_dt0204488 [Dactylella cylindrospora]
MAAKEVEGDESIKHHQSTIKNKGWGQVDALDGISIAKVISNPGGHVQLAISDDGTGYIWGGDGTEVIDSLPGNKLQVQEDEEEEEQDEVGLIDLLDPSTREPLDFENAGCGEDHVVLIEKGGGGVWVSGASDAGQLGFGVEYRCLPTALGIDEDVRKEKGKWRRWSNGIIGGLGRVVQIECGFGSTMIVIDRGSEEGEMEVDS